MIHIYVESLTETRFVAWVFDQEHPARRFDVTLQIDAERHGPMPATLFREHLRQAGKDDGQIGVEIDYLPNPDIHRALLKGLVCVELQDLTTGTKVSAGEIRLEIPAPIHVASRRAELLTVLHYGESEDLLDVLDASTADQLISPHEALGVLNFARAVIPMDERSPRFLETAIRLAEQAGKPLTAKHYRARHLSAAPIASGSLPPDIQPIYSIRKTYASTTSLAIGPKKTIFCLRHIPALTMDGRRHGSRLISLGHFPLDPAPCGNGQSITILPLAIHWFGHPDTYRTLRHGQPKDSFAAIYRLDFEQLREVVEGGGVLLLDMSGEGSPIDDKSVRILNEAFADLAIPSRSVLFVNFNLAFAGDARNAGFHCSVDTANYYLTECANVIARQFSDERALIRHVSAILEHRRSSTTLKNYMCLNFTLRWHRWAIVLELFDRGLIPRGAVSFAGKNSPKIIVHDIRRDMPPLPGRERYLSRIDDLLRICPLTIDIDASAVTMAELAARIPDFVFPIDAMANSLVHFVTETMMTSGSMQDVTEKILKPVVGLQPFVVLGNRGALRLMREMGFQTFDGLIDESYDDIVDYAERFEAAKNECIRLARMDVDELRARIEPFHGALVHNLLHAARVLPMLLRQGIENQIAETVAAMRRM